MMCSGSCVLCWPVEDVWWSSLTWARSQSLSDLLANLCVEDRGLAKRVDNYCGGVATRLWVALCYMLAHSFSQLKFLQKFLLIQSIQNDQVKIVEDQCSCFSHTSLCTWTWSKYSVVSIMVFIYLFIHFLVDRVVLSSSQLSRCVNHLRRDIVDQCSHQCFFFFHRVSDYCTFWGDSCASSSQYTLGKLIQCSRSNKRLYSFHCVGTWECFETDLSRPRLSFIRCICGKQSSTFELWLGRWSTYLPIHFLTNPELAFLLPAV